MPSSAAIRFQIETTLANRVPAALTLKIKQAPELLATGIAEVDAVLDGGIPRGCITEVAGAASTGKTSFGLLAIAAITQSGAACALGRCQRYALARVGSGSGCGAEAAALAPHLGRTQTNDHEQTVAASRTGIEGDRFTSSGWRLRSHCPRYERCAPTTHHAYSTGDVVSLPYSGGTGAHRAHLPFASALRA